MNNVFWNSCGNPIEVGGGGWGSTGTEVIGNITNTGDVIKYRTDAVPGDFHTLQDNIVNAAGNMGMQSPKQINAAESDFRITDGASVLIGAAKSQWVREGFLTASAPSRDYGNLPRPINGSFDLGAYEY